MALGLGFANPELKRAQMMAQLQGSTAIPTAGGGTTAPTPFVGQEPQVNAPAQVDPQALAAAAAQAGPDAMAQAMQQSSGAQPQQPQARDINAEALAAAQNAAPGTPKWARIMGAIGHVLLSADAGYHGRGMPSSPAKQWRAEDNQQEQVQELLVNTVAQAYEASRKVPPEQRGAVLEKFNNAVKALAPDFDLLGLVESLQTDSERLDQLAPAIASMSPEAKSMFMSQLKARGGDAKAAEGLLKDEGFMNGLLAYEDEKNSASLKYKSEAIRGAMAKRGIRQETLAEMTPEEFAQVQNNLPEEYRLTPSELQSMKRNPAYAKLFGLRTPDQEGEQTLDSRAGVQREPSEADVPRQSPVASGPAASAPRRASSPPPGPTQRPQAAQPKAKQQQQPRDPYKPKGEGPVYTRKGYDSSLADPYTQRQLAKVADERGLSRDQVEEAISQSGDAPPQQTKAPQGKGGGGEQRFKIPKGGKTIPGVGKMKEGETVIYDPATRKYRRG